MELVVEQQGDVTILSLLDTTLDAQNADDLQRDLTPLLQRPAKYVLDLGRIQFVDSRGCSLIISALKGLQAGGGELRICGLNPAVKTAFNLIRLPRLCPIHDTQAEAIRAYQDGGQAAR